MSEMETIYRFDERKHEMTITRKHDLVSPVDATVVVGNRDVVDHFTEEGIRNMMTELQSQKNSYEKQSKVLMNQIEAVKEVEIDHDFMEKFDNVQAMKGKQQKLDQLKNADAAIKELNKQINDVKNAVGDRLKW